jgi:hypothetical protein
MQSPKGKHFGSGHIPSMLNSIHKLLSMLSLNSKREDVGYKHFWIHTFSMCCKDGGQECSWACAASFPKKF